MNILVLNAGSATLKYKLFHMSEKDEQGHIESVLEQGRVEATSCEDMLLAAKKVLEQCPIWCIHAVVYRFVHGGTRFHEPTRLTPEIVAELKTFAPMDPLHNPTETAMIEAGLALLINVPAIAVFDTSFHQTLPEVAWRYALPLELTEKLQLRRYGFHGISHEYASRRLADYVGEGANQDVKSDTKSRYIVCHLGNGGSVCAVKDGKASTQVWE